MMLSRFGSPHLSYAQLFSFQVLYSNNADSRGYANAGTFGLLGRKKGEWKRAILEVDYTMGTLFLQDKDRIIMSETFEEYKRYKAQVSSLDDTLVSVRFKSGQWEIMAQNAVEKDTLQHLLELSKHPKMQELLQASKSPTQTQKASSQSLQSPRQSRSGHLQRRETSKEQRSNATKGKGHVVEQPPASIGHRQFSTHGLVNGQDSNEQTRRQTIPMPMSNAGCFGGGLFFQAMIRPSPALHGFMPDNAYGAMPPGGSNPMYVNIGVQPGFQCAAGSYGMPGANMGMAGFAQPDAQNLNMAGRPSGNFGSGIPLLNAPAYDNLTPKGKPKDYKEGGQAVKFDIFHGTHDKLKALLFLQQFDAAFVGGNFTEASKIRKAATFLKTNALQWWTTLLNQGVVPST
ncbi:hypothetical protein L7F22_012124 [Adiantum nelumboides]|nr:hypothetical protein [Adiantum nelumboides]